MAGAAGGALQTGQRLGAAVGTAALPGLYYLVLGNKSDDYRGALFLAMAAGLLGMAASLTLAAYDWRRDRRTREPHGPCPDDVAHSPVHARQT
jgi:hypothetical protein